MSPATVTCARCGRTAPAATDVLVGGALGDKIRSSICDECWQEWQRNEVMVINELRLNFMDPKSQDILTQHMRDFLMLS